MLTQEVINQLRNKRLLVTGGTGFFGKNICEYLVSLNDSHQLNLSIFSMARNKVDMSDVTFLQQDVALPFSFDEKMDYIIHAATPVVANDDFHSTMEIIVNGTKNTLDYATRSGCQKFLLVSSGAVYGELPPHKDAFVETDDVAGLFYDQQSAYGTGKRISELLGSDWSVKNQKNLTIARCFAFSGKHLPVDKHLAIGNFVKDALDGKDILIKSDGSAQRTYMDATDLVEWLLTILINGQEREVYNVGSDQVISVKELAEKIASLAGHIKVSITGQPGGKRSRYIPSISKSRERLGLKITVTLDDSLKKMIQLNRG